MLAPIASPSGGLGAVAIFALRVNGRWTCRGRAGVGGARYAAATEAGAKILAHELLLIGLHKRFMPELQAYYLEEWRVRVHRQGRLQVLTMFRKDNVPTPIS